MRRKRRREWIPTGKDNLLDSMLIERRMVPTRSMDSMDTDNTPLLPCLL